MSSPILKRSLSTTDLVVYGLVFIVPIAPFGIFGSVYQASHGMVVSAYGLGLIAMLFTAVSYGQMSVAFPIAGSVYSYVGQGIAPCLGFLTGWMIGLDYLLVPGLLYLVAGQSMAAMIPLVPAWLWVAGFVLTNTLVNVVGVSFTAKVNSIVLAAEFVVLAIFLAFGSAALVDGHGHGPVTGPLYAPGQFSWNVVFGAVSVAALSFLGFDGISTLAEETTAPPHAIGRAMIIVLLLSGSLFIAETWIAALLTSNGRELIRDGDGSGTAFYRAAGVAGGRSCPF